MGEILWYLLIGFIAGSLAKMILPGDKFEPKGCLFTIILGIAGSVLVGFLMRQLLGTAGGGGFIGSVFGATIGAIVLIVLARKFIPGAQESGDSSSK
jgi:uncharacterized membrane protein YeaQ/YmgE (transglycosylase-associated protein family)